VNPGTAIRQTGQLADARLEGHRHRLTQGGEPTFTASDPTAPEWNTAALGPLKLQRARTLARKLVVSLLPGAVPLKSYGKLYPGELLPRWWIGLHSLADGNPLWSQPDLLLLHQAPPSPPNPDAPERLLRRLAQHLRIPRAPFPAFQDVADFIRHAEAAGETHSRPRYSRITGAFELQPPWTPEEAAKWRRFHQPAAWVLPLTYHDGQWVTQSWNLPGGQDLILLPGDSPAGLRLPLDRLPPTTLRCAITAEIAAGELLLFLPPLPSLEAFQNLVHALEHLAAAGEVPPIVLEGYPPPRDARLVTLGLTADPGVIEINLPPCDRFDKLSELATRLYPAAHECDLRGFKFRHNGRRIGTGGGAHILLGGPDLEDNPFLKCPHLLSSFIRFIQHHPALSYAFTGLFAGPSCQAPRVDESLPDLPGELELTLRALESMPTPADPVLIDSMLRNLLLDWNGNTHRAEICVDKFHNPHLPNGRLGLAEFRAIEMMPDASMFLAVNALFRALAACFAESPFTHPLINWGSALHDRFALPWFLERDLADVIAFLRKKDFPIEAEQFEPHFEYRFPTLHQWDSAGASGALRHALEFWPVMGERPGPHGATTRPVDASTDRLQITLTRRDKAPLPLISVNNVHVPLPVQPDGNAVGAVRFRLFDNPDGLQPHIRSHCPLTFEIIDPSTRLVTHAFQYLHWKPGPNPYEGYPLTDDEAQERVRERVIRRPDLEGRSASFREPEPRPDTPFTLDLRSC
jgi:uncharacterized protein (DUF2126 family)